MTNKLRNFHRMSGGGIRNKDMMKNFAKDRHPGTNIKRSLFAFSYTCIALSWRNLAMKLIEVPAQSL